MNDPNSHQVGGNHYRKVPGEQHWDRMWRIYGPDVAWVYFVGQITLYVERYRDKNGIEDLKKARHFLDKLISLEEKDGIGKKENEVVQEDLRGRAAEHMVRLTGGE